MILLVVDTSGKHGSVALARTSESAEATDVKVIESIPLAGGTFSAQLVPQIAGLLNQHGLSKSDIDAFIVVSGPGSFTGLRVGLAAIKALAEILRKPIVPVSLLEVIAIASRTQGRIAAALDAGRGEIYVGEYTVDGQSAQPLREQLLSKEEFLAARKGAVATPDAAFAQAGREAGLSVFAFDPPNAQIIGSLGWSKLRSRDTVSPEQLEANYIRRSDAEIFAKIIP